MAEELSHLVLLRIAGTNPPIHIVKETYATDDESAEYLFDEILCPSGIVQATAVIEGTDTDPHGIFEFVQIVPKPTDWPFVGTVDFARYKMLFDKLAAEAQPVSD